MKLVPVFKALADPTRLRLLAVLAQAELTVQELTEILVLGQSRISRHLKILIDAGLLAVQRQGTWRYYRCPAAQEPLRALWPVLASGMRELPTAGADRTRLQAALERRRQASQVFFERHANQWELLAERFLPVESWRPALLARLPETGTLLDVGVGTGALLPALSTSLRPVIGVDQSPAMLAEARRRVTEQPLAGEVELRLGEMSHLPLPDGAVDTALLHLSLHHTDRPQATFDELKRVLRLGGRLVILDLQRHELEWAREELGDQWLGFDRKDLTGWLTTAGFEIESYQTLSGRPGPFDAFLLCAATAAS